MAIQFSSPTNPNNFFNRGLRSARDYLSGVRQRNAARQPIIPDPGKIQSSTPAVPAGFNYQPPNFSGALQGIKSFLKPSQPLYTGPEEPIMTSAVPGITYGKPVSRLPGQPPTAEELKSRAATFWSPQPSIPLTPQPIAPVSPDLTPAPTPTAPPPPTGQIPPQGAPVLPQIPPTAEQIQQAIPQTSATPSGIAAPLTGGATSGAAGAGAGIQTPLAGGLDPAMKKAIEDAEKAVQEANKISAEELTSQDDLDRLQEATRRAYRSTQDQPIALDFITGQLASLERRALGLAEPLENKLARLQAKRTATLAGSKFALERLDKEAERQRGKTGEAFTLSPGETRYGPTGQVLAKGQEKPAETKAPTTIETAQGIMQWDPSTGTWKSTGLKKGSEAGAVSPYQEERTIRTIQSVDELLTKAKNNPGIFGRTAAAPIPEFLRTDAYRNFSAELDTLKSNIAFSELTAMREASKTGGALGQVSDRESQLLQSALGALSMTQNPKNVQNQLQKIKDSINRWRKAVGAQAIRSNIVTASDGQQVEIID